MRTDHSSDGLATTTLLNLLKVANKLMAPYSTYLERRYAISLNEFRLLMLIGQNPDVAGHELAAITGVSAMSVSRAIAALQKHGRIETRTDQSNKRRKILRLTAEGQRLFSAMQPQSQQVADYLISSLEPGDVAMLNQYLQTMISSLDAQDEHGNSLFMEHTRPRD